MTIEKEFFEAFKGINKLYSTWVDEYSNSDYYPNYRYKTFKSYNEARNKMIDERWDFEDGDFVKNTIDEHYPPITPEIVLELEDILIKHTFAYINMEGRKIIENAPFGYIHKYGLYECHCGISSTHKIGKGKTRIESLLNLCIQLKDEIQDPVKVLFNELKQQKA